MDEFTVRLASISHLKEIVRVHKITFSNFFLTSLGDFFLHTYYKALLKSKDGIAFILTESNDSVIGFAVGTLNAIDFHKRLIMNNLFQFSFSAIIILILQPLSVYRLFKNLDKKSSISDDGNYSELLSIGIDQNYIGKGLGKVLISAFEKDVKRRGGNKLSLTTDFHDNENVINFYIKRGYIIMTDFTTYPSRKMYRLIKSLD